MAVRGPRMNQGTQPETEFDRLVRKINALKMSVSHVFIGIDGKKFLAVNGFALRVDDLLEMERADGLTPWGISEYVEKHKVKR
jgi:hypothetical protein